MFLGNIVLCSSRICCLANSLHKSCHSERSEESRSLDSAGDNRFLTPFGMTNEVFFCVPLRTSVVPSF